MLCTQLFMLITYLYDWPNMLHEFYIKNNLKYVYMKERRCKRAKKDSRTSLMVDKNEIRKFIYLQIIL